MSETVKGSTTSLMRRAEETLRSEPGEKGSDLAVTRLWLTSGCHRCLLALVDNKYLEP